MTHQSATDTQHGTARVKKPGTTNGRIAVAVGIKPNHGDTVQ